MLQRNLKYLLSVLGTSCIVLYLLSIIVQKSNINVYNKIIETWKKCDIFFCSWKFLKITLNILYVREPSRLLTRKLCIHNAIRCYLQLIGMYLPNEDKISVNVPTLDLNSLLVANCILSRYEYIIYASSRLSRSYLYWMYSCGHKYYILLHWKVDVRTESCVQKGIIEKNSVFVQFSPNATNFLIIL